MSHGPQPDKIQKMFSEIAGGYDKANSVLSFGVHHFWRWRLVRFSEAKLGQSVLDCATGTGDLAIVFKQVVGSQAKVVGTDFCKEMLDFAPAKAKAQNLDIEFRIADAMALDFPDHSFDIVSISFGIRNVADPVKALSEMARVCKPGGKVMVLEFGQTKIPGFAQAYEYYSNKLLPKIGGLITGKADAYQYLQDSSAKFPCADEFLSMAAKTNAFKKMSYKPLFGGIAYMYKLELNEAVSMH